MSILILEVLLKMSLIINESEGFVVGTCKVCDVRKYGLVKASLLKKTEVRD